MSWGTAIVLYVAISVALPFSWIPILAGWSW